MKFFAPFFVAFFPLTHLAATNIKEIRLISTIRSFFIIIIVVFLANILLRLFIKDRGKTSIILSLLIIVSFSFGHLTNLVRNFMTIPDRYIFITVFALCAFFIWKILKIKKIPSYVTKYIILSFGLLTLLSIFRIGFYLTSSSSSRIDSSQNSVYKNAAVENPRDIYYIILDAHAGDDILEDLYGYDDKNLTNYLRTNGFYVAEKSQANYLFTSGSVSSSLNFDYLDNLISNFDINNVDSSVWDKLIQDNKTAQKLKNFGYTYYTFRTEFGPLQKNPSADTHFGHQINLNNFEIAFINNSILRYILNLFFDLTTVHKNTVLFTLEKLKDISLDQKPTFTYAHILSPHAPYVFDKKGNYFGKGKKLSFVENPLKEGKTIEEYRALYLNQLIFIDNKTIETIDYILNNSQTPPIIIIQGDHGPPTEYHLKGDLTDLALRERSSILNAYLLPNCEKEPYGTISSVNTFRLLFSSCFGEDLKFLEDRTIPHFQEN